MGVEDTVAVLAVGSGESVGTVRRRLRLPVFGGALALKALRYPIQMSED